MGNHKPWCPFCGSDMFPIGGEEMNIWYYKCRNCFACGPIRRTKDEAEESVKKRFIDWLIERKENK